MPSTTKEIIEVTQLNMQKARHAQIELLNKLNKGKNPFIILTQEPCLLYTSPSPRDS